MHHQVGVGDGLVDLSDAGDGQHLTGWLAGELVSAVAGADGDGEGIHLGLGDEVSSFSRIGQQLIVGEGTLEAVSVLGFTLAGLKGTKATQLTFHTHADGVGHVHHFLGDRNVVLVGRGGLGVGLQRAVHHH